MLFIKKIRNTNANNKIILKNTMGAFLVKGGALLVSLFTMPAYMRYFNNQQVLGVWFTILSVLMWILNFDLGIGNGLRNKLVHAISDNNNKAIKTYISSAYLVVGFLAIVFVLVGYFISPWIPWNTVFNVPEDMISSQVLLSVTQWVYFGIILQFFLRIISSILYALQMSAINNLIRLFSSILQLLFVLLASSNSPDKNLIMLSQFFVISANLPLLAATILIFTTKLKGGFPSIRFAKKTYALSILKLGGLFFWCQIMYMVIVNTNEFFITQYANPADVVDYQIYQKLFNLSGMFLTLALTPIWSAVTKSIAEANYLWLDKLYRVLKKVGMLAVLGEFLMIPLLQFIINFWLKGNAISVNYVYAFVFAVLGGSFLYQSILSTIVCGIGDMRFQMICYTVGVVLKLLIIHVIFQFYQGWIIVIIANVAVILPYCILQQIQLDKYIKEHLK